MRLLVFFLSTNDKIWGAILKIIPSKSDSTSNNLFRAYVFVATTLENANLQRLVEENTLALPTVFPSTYLCDLEFSRVVTIKTIARNRLLDLGLDLHCLISKIAHHISSIAIQLSGSIVLKYECNYHQR